MILPVERKNTIVAPDNRRVIARFFQNGDERAKKLVENIILLPEKEVEQLTHQILREFSKRHRSITGIFNRHFKKVGHVVEEVTAGQQLSERRKLLIGSYFTMEYALESAALFNPSVVEDFDQSGLRKGQKRVIISFRATGEGHISSLVFRRAVINEDNSITIYEPGDQIGEAERIKSHVYHKKVFLRVFRQMDIDQAFSESIMEKLPDRFTYDQMREVVDNLKRQNPNFTFEQNRVIDEILWLADSHTEIRFSLDTDLSERVIFPISRFEKNGIEDARFTRFVNSKGEVTYYATYTAYDGYSILPKLIETKDFLTFKMFPLTGKYAIDKNLVLFPRKINNKYAMISRIDGINNYIMFSDNLHKWHDAKILSEPAHPWEFVQMGNGGSPIETDKGWLLITHGVGPVRKYCLGAYLLDLNDPSKVIGRLNEPLLLPDENERSGYVPNVVYTCGAIVHNDELIIPYAMSDYASSFAGINLNNLLDELLKK
ncbi:MAG TPA: glycosidase [Mariniphaga anaerophila]|uniref:Glycosidase n=1 Tax=Mariniphaga anaerophila TaxID=1484053 RepID=A0A831LU79_9BACT|nr:glycosidase [Mariniphaga anaerophila]